MGVQFRWWLAAAVLATVFAAAAYLWLGRSPGPSRGVTGPGPVATPLTAYPGVESKPSLSPDGSQVAFEWNGPRQDNYDIYVKLVGPGEPLRLTSSPARDDSAAWSPDGRQIGPRSTSSMPRPAGGRRWR